MRHMKSFDSARWRHELKYSITYAQRMELVQRVREVMTLDPHVDEDGTYLIRSIYLETPDDRALREKLSGVARRQKFRIRYYNNDTSRLKLEKKVKVNDLGTKFSAPLTEDECRAIIAGDIDWMADSPHALIRELHARTLGEMWRPRVLVSYRRIPFVYGPGNVRVTFDFDISTSLYSDNFLEPDWEFPVETEKFTVMEVKYDDFLPDIIRCLIQTGETRQVAVSKYGLSRRFG